MNQTAYQPPTWSVMPPVIKNLLIINGLVYFATVAPQMQAFLFQWFALWPAGTPDVAPSRFGQVNAVPQFYPWQLVTTAFLHGGLGHIFFNMFGLWMFGMRIENTWGSQRFLFFYFFCVIGASLLQLLVTSSPFLFGIGDPVIVPTVGASGGVFGVLLAFGMMYPEERVMLLIPPIPIKAKWFVTGLMVLQLYAGVTGTQAGVANFAHLGGALAGFLLIQYWRGKLPIGPQPRRAGY
ncbi:MAG: rhomboid family intramembrane serine protease [Rhodothermales bacterium]